MKKNCNNNSNEINKVQILGYVDADWGSNRIDRISFTGYIFKLGNSTIIWKSQKQKSVSLSSAEAEYVAISEATKEILFLKNLLSELSIDFEIILYNDNQSAQLLANNSIFHSRSKHIDLKHHFVRDIIRDKIFNLKYLSTEKMIADVMTKPLNKNKHKFCVEGISMRECI